MSRELASPLLAVRDLSIGFEGNTLLESVSFDVFDRELLMLMGPAGVGKSTLLRVLSQYACAWPSLWVHGEVLLDGALATSELGIEQVHQKLPMLAQKARLFTASIGENAIAGVAAGAPLSYAQKREQIRQVLERCQLWDELAPRLDQPATSLSIARQRMLCVARLLGGGARCIFADEPFRDIDPSEGPDLALFFERLKSQCAVVMISHEQHWARQLADRVCLLAAGRVIEIAPAARFFSEPETELGRTFVRTGNCWPKDGVAHPAASTGAPAPAARAASARPSAEESRPRPSGFHWIVRGLLGGTQWPGLIGDESRDLDALAELGVVHLVSCTEQPFPSARLEPRGIRGHHFPIVDMDVPTHQAAASLCQQLSRWMAEREPVVLHCKAGLGRTGTMLACLLAYRGTDPVSAIHELRLINRYYIQSEKQLQFISSFWEYSRQPQAATP